MVDRQAVAGIGTTRVDLALETLQAILFSARSGRLTTRSGMLRAANEFLGVIHDIASATTRHRH